MMLWYGHDVSGWGYAGMAVGMVVFWGLVAAGIVVLVQFASRDRMTREVPPSEHSAAQQVLAMRFARGEIDEKEYRDKLATLRDHSAV
jgi:putative membrane protein